MVQVRIFVAWQRIIYPDSSALDIGAMPGADE
jgi:type IV secretory pathway VirB10-like protein